LRKETSGAGKTPFISNLIIPMKASTYVKDDFMDNMGDSWNFLMLFVFIAPVYRLIHNIVNEKEQRVRELMRMMGLTDFPYWLSWYTYYVLTMTFICFVMTLILIPVFKISNLFLVFGFLWCFGMALFSYAIFISSFFSNGKVASIAGSMILFFSSFLILICGEEQSSIAVKHLFSIFPMVSVQLAGPIMFALEAKGTGVQFSNWE
jgi:hypothetical protein